MVVVSRLWKQLLIRGEPLWRSLSTTLHGTTETWRQIWLRNFSMVAWSSRGRKQRNWQQDTVLSLMKIWRYWAYLSKMLLLIGSLSSIVFPSLLWESTQLTKQQLLASTGSSVRDRFVPYQMTVMFQGNSQVISSYQLSQHLSRNRTLKDTSDTMEHIHHSWICLKASRREFHSVS